MLVGSLFAYCLNVIIQQLCLYRNGKKTFSKFLEQFQQNDMIVEVFSQKIFNVLVERYPTVVTDDIVRYLCHQNMKMINLIKCKNITLAGLADLLERCDFVDVLNLSECDQLMAEELYRLLKDKSHLKCLMLENCSTLTDEILSDLLFTCDKLQTLSIEGCDQIQDDLLFCHLSSHERVCQNLTSVNVSGCRRITTTFIRHLTEVTQSNLRSINISLTNIDCIALLYLAGYSTSLAMHIASLKPQQVYWQEQLATGTEEVINLNMLFDEYNSIAPPRISKSNSCDYLLSTNKVKSASGYIKELCAYCAQEIATRKQSTSSSFDVFTESFDDYDVIDSQIVTVLENDKTLLNNCADASSLLHLEWDILSVNDLNFTVQPGECTCSSSVSPGTCRSSFSVASDCVIESKIEKANSLFRPLFTPKLNCVDITQIDFYNHNIGRLCIEYFMNANQCLEEFHTSWQDLDNDVLNTIASNATELCNLSLVDCEKVTDDGLLSVGKHCHKLKSIDLKGVSFVTDTALVSLVSQNEQLQTISFAESALTDVVLKNASNKLAHSLHTLDLSWCENITNDGALSILRSCKKLCSIDLRQCHHISQETIDGITEHGTQLTVLGVCGVTGLNDPTCQRMFKALPRLRKIDLSWNSSLTDESISALFLSCASIREVTVAGLKRITAKPFLPIISGLKQWRSAREAIRLRLQMQMASVGRGLMKDVSAYEALDPEFYLPFRSVNYAPDLRKLTLGYCDQVDDNHLGEIVAVCRNTLMIEDYYGETIKPKWKDLSALDVGV